jgi:hypothetical protein
MSPDLMALGDWIEIEKEKSRWAAMHTLAFTTLLFLEKAPPDIEAAIAHLKHWQELADGAMEHYRKLEGPEKQDE